MDHTTAKTLCARIIGCHPDQLINFRLTPAGAIAIAPDGRKFHFTLAELEREHSQLKPAQVRKNLLPGKQPDRSLPVSSNGKKQRRRATPAKNGKEKVS